MDLTTFSLIVGVSLLLIGVPLILFPSDTAHWLLHVMRDDVLLRLIGAVELTIAVLVLSRGFRVGLDVAGLLRIVAWIAVLEGIGACWWPDEPRRFAKFLLKSPVWRTVFGVLSVVFGILFFSATRAGLS